MEHNAISPAYIKSLISCDDKTIVQIQLEEILNTDIHQSSLGCKIANTHIRIGKVHLDTFYEAQLLFGNAYWSDVFSYYFYSFIKKKIRSNKITRKQPIILYGYESYSTLSLNKAITLLNNDGYNALMRIFEVRDNRVRYCAKNEKTYKEDDSDLFNKDPVVFFFVGISSTLSTFKHMSEALFNTNSQFAQCKMFCTSVIQVVGSTRNDASKNYIELHSDNHGQFVICKNQENYLSFIRKRHYKNLISLLQLQQHGMNHKTVNFVDQPIIYLKSH